MQLFNDHFQNYKRYGIPKCQLLIADVPYNLGNNAYASNQAQYAMRQQGAKNINSYGDSMNSSLTSMGSGMGSGFRDG